MHEKTSPLVYSLVILFGSSTWLVVTAVWVQLQLMVSIYPLPEGWSLPSYLTVIVQVAVLGPILHWLLKKYSPDSNISDEKIQIYFCMGFATLSTLFLAIFWQHRIYLFGQERSVLLFVFVFCVSLVSCTSSVLYLPYMFRPGPDIFEILDLAPDEIVTILIRD
uniref:Riboflavin transporter n=1 Tax=Romanomermis culicivorax TaxID=13658 RepID=A0A915L750_ROMCU